MSAAPQFELTNPMPRKHRPMTERRIGAMIRIRGWIRNRARLERARERCVTGGELAAGVRSRRVYPHAVAARSWRSSVADQIGGYVAAAALWQRPGVLLTRAQWAELLTGRNGRGVSLRTVERAIQELAEAEWVRVSYRFPGARGESQAANLLEAGPAMLEELALLPRTCRASGNPDPSFQSPEVLSRVVITEIEIAAGEQPSPPSSPDIPSLAPPATSSPAPAKSAGGGLRPSLKGPLTASLARAAAESDALEGGSAGSDRHAVVGGGPVTFDELRAMAAGVVARLDAARPAASSGPSSPPARRRRGAA